MEIDPFKSPWYVAGAPWVPSDLMPYIIAGHYDPHVGMPVVDMFDPEEWAESCEAEPFNPADMAQHICDLQNDRLRRLAPTRELVVHIERYFQRLSGGEIPAKDKPPAECHGLLSACLQELRRNLPAEPWKIPDEDKQATDG